MAALQMTLWCLAVYLLSQVSFIDMRERIRELTPAEVLEYQKRSLGNCFFMDESSCPFRYDPPCGIEDTDSGAVAYCCRVDNVTLINYLQDNSRSVIYYLNVMDSNITELDVSLPVFHNLISIAFTDGSIGKIVGQFPESATVQCLNISNNQLTSAQLPSRPFAHLPQLMMLDASANNLTEFPLGLVPRNQKTYIDLTGNDYIPCAQFQEAMSYNASSLIFLNYNYTNCVGQANFTWSSDVILPVEHLRVGEQVPDPFSNDEKDELGYCFRLDRDWCHGKDDPCGLETTDSGTVVFCCEVDNVTLIRYLQDNEHERYTDLVVMDSNITEVNVSLSLFHNLTSMAFYDGNIGQIVGQFPKHSRLECLNISNNHLTTDKLPQRPFAYLFNLALLDASANDLTEFPLSLVQASRKVFVDLSGNDHIPCQQYQEAILHSTSSFIFLNYNNTNCIEKLEPDLYPNVILPINHLRVPGEVPESRDDILFPKEPSSSPTEAEEAGSSPYQEPSPTLPLPPEIPGEMLNETNIPIDEQETAVTNGDVRKFYVDFLRKKLQLEVRNLELDVWEKERRLNVKPSNLTQNVLWAGW